MICSFLKLIADSMNFVHFIKEFFLIALLHLLAVATPGPDFAIIFSNSVNYGKLGGIFTALGIASGVFGAHDSDYIWYQRSVATF